MYVLDISAYLPQNLIKGLLRDQTADIIYLVVNHANKRAPNSDNDP